MVYLVWGNEFFLKNPILFLKLVCMFAFQRRKEMTVTNWFEDFTKTLGDDKMGRRTAIRRVAGTVAGIAIASALPGSLQARTSKHCPSGGCSCGISDCQNCVGISNTNCFCWYSISGKAVCFCNSYCSQLSSCSKSSKCSKGYVCIVSTGCNCSYSQGVCVPNCVKKKYRNCQLGSGHGATVAGRVL